MKVSLRIIVLIVLLINTILFIQCTVTLPGSNTGDDVKSSISSSSSSSSSSEESSSSSSSVSSASPHVPQLLGITANPNSINGGGTVEIILNALDSGNDIIQVTILIDAPDNGTDRSQSLTYNTTSLKWTCLESFIGSEPVGDWIITNILLFDSAGYQREYKYISSESADRYVYLEDGSYINSSVPIASIIKNK